MFRLNSRALVGGTCFSECVIVSPSKLVATFGKPLAADGYKSSGEYIFENKKGQPVILYDWKCTSLYDSIFSTPEEFWSSSEPEEFHVGGASEGFAEWLLAEVSNEKSE